jgi:hypothetical protein
LVGKKEGALAQSKTVRKPTHIGTSHAFALKRIRRTISEIQVRSIARSR